MLWVWVNYAPNPNPGSEEGTVPAWAGGTAMMYLQNEGEIREWIKQYHSPDDGPR
jgi:hypothetical protein